MGEFVMMSKIENPMINTKPKAKPGIQPEAVTIAKAMMASSCVRNAVNQCIDRSELHRNLRDGIAGDIGEFWAASVLAKAMVSNAAFGESVRIWVNNHNEERRQRDRQSERIRKERWLACETLRAKIRAHEKNQNQRRKSEKESRVEFIVMREYKAKISGIRRIERLTIDKSPAFRNHVNRKRHERNKVRSAEEPEFRIHQSYRRRVRDFIIGRTMRTHSLVGCSWSDFRLWLESKFKPGMSWENYGEWEIDHIKPCASFDLKIKEQLHQCFHYSNTQPLWKSENAKKSSGWQGVTYRKSTGKKTITTV
jgi:hypothetical protein